MNNTLTQFATTLIAHISIYEDFRTKLNEAIDTKGEKWLFHLYDIPVNTYSFIRLEGIIEQDEIDLWIYQWKKGRFDLVCRNLSKPSLSKLLLRLYLVANEKDLLRSLKTPKDFESFANKLHSYIKKYHNLEDKINGEQNPVKYENIFRDVFQKENITELTTKWDAAREKNNSTNTRKDCGCFHLFIQSLEEDDVVSLLKWLDKQP